MTHFLNEQGIITVRCSSSTEAVLQRFCISFTREVQLCFVTVVTLLACLAAWRCERSGHTPAAL